MNILNKLLNIMIARPLLKIFLGSCGEKFRLGPSSHLRSINKIFIGDNFFSGPRCYMSTSKYCEIKIGNNVMLGPNVTFLGGNHNIDLLGMPMNEAPHRPDRDKGIIVADDVWIGAGVIVLDGANLAEGTVIAAGSVVNKKTLPFSVYGGVPARFIKFRK